MTQNEMERSRSQHFLFYIFKMDMQENPMPAQRAAELLRRMKRIFTKEG